MDTCGTYVNTLELVDTWSRVIVPFTLVTIKLNATHFNLIHQNQVQFCVDNCGAFLRMNYSIVNLYAGYILSKYINFMKAWVILSNSH